MRLPVVPLPNRRSATLTVLVLGYLLAIETTSLESAEPASAGFGVQSFGARGNGTDKDTASIQSAIDACHQAGGGTVTFPKGTFLSGSLHLKSNVALHFDHGTVLRASPDKADFDPYEKLDFKNAADNETSYFHHALIWGEDVEHVAITGSGTIDCNRKRRGGPKAIALKRCKHVLIKDLTIRDCPNYCISMLGTDYVNIDGVTILNGFADGIDPDCCHHVRISNCHVESHDDAICPKASLALGVRRSVENLVVTNCVVSTDCNAFKLGTESGGDFKNITVSNCTIFRRPDKRPAISGISLLSVDGSNIEGVTISNIVMSEVYCPIFLRLGNRGRDLEKPVPGSLRNVILSDIVARDVLHACSILGLPGHPIEGVTLDNIRVTFTSGGKMPAANTPVPEKPAEYPSANKFPDLPAYGIYCRHARDLHLARINLGCKEPDLRHALVCDDVGQVSIDSVHAAHAPGGLADYHLNQVKGATIRGWTSNGSDGACLKVSGSETTNIRLVGNDFGSMKKPIEMDAGVSQKEVRSLSQ